MGAICNTIERVFIKRSGTSGIYHPAQWLIDCFTGSEESASGVRVNAQSALKYTPFWAAVRIISGTLAALPFKVYQDLDEKGKKPYKQHPVYKLIHTRPNDYIDAVTFKETLHAHVLTYGNGFAEIQRNGASRPVALWPLMPNKAKRVIVEDIPWYEITLPDNTKTYLQDRNILHIKGLGFDGLTGYDVVAYHKAALGYGIAVKEYGSRFFANDASPGGVLEHPSSISKPAYDRLKESWLEAHQGLKQSHRLQILEEGMKFNKTVIDPEQAQALEVQKFTVDDCSRIFNIPPHMLGSMEFSKYNNVEQLGLDFYKQTMLYWFKKWEQEVNYKLFSDSEQDTLFAEILVDGLVRSDMSTRYNAYNIGRQAGFLCVDDIREKENLNPLPDGKGQIFLEPLNMKPAGSPDPALSNNNKTREAFRTLIASCWIRIIKKQNGDLKANIEGARKLLIEPVTALACTVHRYDTAELLLANLLGEIITENIKLTEYDATRLADLTIDRIGGENA